MRSHRYASAALAVLLACTTLIGTTSAAGAASPPDTVPPDAGERALIANTARAHRLVRLATLEYGAERGTIRNAQRGIRMIGILPTVSVAFLVTEDAVAINRILYNGENWTSDD